MAEAETKKRRSKATTKKAKGKQWFTIIAPNVFDNIEIGRTMTSDPEQLVGRRISLSAMELVGNFNKYYIKIIFKIKKIEGDKALTEFDGMECLQDYISRMILHRIRRIDTVQDLKTKDGVNIRIKGLGIISGRIKSSIKCRVRNDIRSMMKKEVERSTLDDIVEKMITDDIKNDVLREARKIYPVRNFEIRKIELR
jgi:small subunit ribosomal protein S3Ae